MVHACGVGLGQASGVAIDAAVESARLVVATHVLASVVAGRQMQKNPASWWPVPHASAETSTLGRRSNRAIPFTLGDRLRPVTFEAIRRIHPPPLTRPAMPVPESSWLTDAGREGERVVTGSDKTSLVWYLEGFPTTGSRGASPKSKIVVGERGGLGIAARVPRDRRPMWAYEPPNDGPPERMTRDPTSIRESLPRADIIRGDHGKCCGSRWRRVPRRQSRRSCYARQSLASRRA